MKYNFSFYTQNDFDEIENLIIKSYSYGYPAFSLSNMDFTNGLHPKFLDYTDVWKKTVGVYRYNNEIVACAINFANDDDAVAFIFDSKERAEDKELLSDMLFFAKTTMSTVSDKNQIERFVRISIPKWNSTLKSMAESQGFVKDWQNRILIKPFKEKHYDVKLPEGYTIADGSTTPAFYLSNVHMASFNYSVRKVPNAANAFAELRKQNHYNPNLDLCILDPQGRPVAIAIIWYDEKMPYCELEPLGVAFWERRKGLATAILNEASNRVIELYPNCRGMLGGDQKFYEKAGYEVKEIIPTYKWETKVYPSWDEKSENSEYRENIQKITEASRSYR